MLIFIKTSEDQNINPYNLYRLVIANQIVPPKKFVLLVDALSLKRRKNLNKYLSIPFNTGTVN